MKHREKLNSPLDRDWLRQADEIAQALRQRAKAEERRLTQAPLTESVRQIEQIWDNAPPKAPARPSKRR
jgi:hypothetical protein